ncbi:transposable element Tc1 transposase [Trichonephila clavipes]|nr:transposable element Tc1 transposase [Trichonephila clavipes]
MYVEVMLFACFSEDHGDFRLRRLGFLHGFLVSSFIAGDPNMTWDPQCTNVGLINSSTSAAPWIACLQWDHEHRAWQADWHQVVYSDESRFNLWDHDGCIRVRRHAGEYCVSECVIEQHSGLTPSVMVWGVIWYHGRSNLIQIEGNLNSNRYVREVLSTARSHSLPLRHPWSYLSAG